MQAYALDSPLARVYPPTVMEWKANRKCVNMALEARYPDGLCTSFPSFHFDLPLHSDMS